MLASEVLTFTSNAPFQDKANQWKKNNMQISLVSCWETISSICLCLVVCVNMALVRKGICLSSIKFYLCFEKGHWIYGGWGIGGYFGCVWQLGFEWSWWVAERMHGWEIWEKKPFSQPPAKDLSSAPYVLDNKRGELLHNRNPFLAIIFSAATVISNTPI